MTIDILYFEGCPHHLPTRERISALLREECCEAEVREVEVPDAATAVRMKFPGSPTVRVNGVDIEPEAADGYGFGLMCRRYPGGIPSDVLIRTAIRLASAPASAALGGSAK
ncbi:MAG TPA: hypothetical protein VGI45_32165 [Terracidiphilus sp.]